MEKTKKFVGTVDLNKTAARVVGQAISGNKQAMHQPIRKAAKAAKRKS